MLNPFFGESALVIGNPGDIERVQDKLDKTAEHFGITLHLADFGGEATREEVNRLKKLAKEKGTDIIVGLGGGKAIDTSKTVANGHNLIVRTNQETSTSTTYCYGSCAERRQLQRRRLPGRRRFHDQRRSARRTHTTSTTIGATAAPDGGGWRASIRRPRE